MKDIKIIIIVVFALLVIAFLAKYAEQTEKEIKSDTSQEKKGILTSLIALFI